MYDEMVNMSVIEHYRMDQTLFPLREKSLFANYDMKIFLGRKHIVLVTQTSTTQ